jgi:hypothetical protein
MKQHAEVSMYWPGINKAIEEFVCTCATCQHSQRQQTREPMLSYEIPTAPDLVVAGDYFSIKGQSYPMISDLFSCWIEVMTVVSEDFDQLAEVLQGYFIQMAFQDYSFQIRARHLTASHSNNWQILGV